MVGLILSVVPWIGQQRRSFTKMYNCGNGAIMFALKKGASRCLLPIGPLQLPI